MEPLQRVRPGYQRHPIISDTLLWDHPSWEDLLTSDGPVNLALSACHVSVRGRDQSSEQTPVYTPANMSETRGRQARFMLMENEIETCSPFPPKKHIISRLR